MTDKELYKALLSATAEAFRIYHMLEDDEVARRQYQVADKLKYLLNEIKDLQSACVKN